MIGTFRKYLKLKQKSRYILKIYGTIYSISEVPINLDFESNKTLSFTNSCDITILLSMFK